MTQIHRLAALSALFAIVATGLAAPIMGCPLVTVQAQAPRNLETAPRDRGDYNDEWRRGGRGFERRPPDQGGGAGQEADEGDEAPGCVFRPRTLELLV